MKKSTQNWLLLLGFLGALTALVVVAPKGTPKPKALAQPPAKVVLGKGEYMRPPSASGSNFFAQPKSRIEADAKTTAAQAKTLKDLGYSATEVSLVTVSTNNNKQ